MGIFTSVNKKPTRISYSSGVSKESEIFILCIKKICLKFSPQNSSIKLLKFSIKIFSFIFNQSNPKSHLFKKLFKSTLFLTLSFFFREHNSVLNSISNKKFFNNSTFPLVSNYNPKSNYNSAT